MGAGDLRRVDVHCGTTSLAGVFCGAEVIGMGVRQHDRGHLGGSAAESAQRRLDARPASRPAGVVERDLPAVIDEVLVDYAVGHAVNAVGDLLGQRHGRLLVSYEAG